MKFKAVGFFVLAFFTVLLLVNFFLLDKKNAHKVKAKELSHNLSSTIWTQSSVLLNNNSLEPSYSILQVNLHYNVSAVPILKLNKAKKMNGYIPTQFTSNDMYKIELIGKDNQVLSETFFIIPTEKIDENINKSYFSGARNTLNETDLVVTLPWKQEAVGIKVLNSNAKVIMAEKLGVVDEIFNIPDFHSVTGEKIVSKEDVKGASSDMPSATTPDLLGFINNFKTFFNTDNYENPTKTDHINPSNKYENIVFISQGFSQQQFIEFHNDVNRTISYAVNHIEPFRSRKEQFRFSYIDNQENLGCTVERKMLICPVDKVIQRVQQSGVPWNDIVVIVNNKDTIAATGYLRSHVMQLPDNFFLELGFPHEFGHAFAALEDEYDTGTVNTSLVNKAPNCSVSNSNVKWQNLVAAQDYIAFCGGNNNWFRSSENSIMRDPVWADYYNAPSQDIILKYLDAIVGKSLDIQSPTIVVKIPSIKMGKLKGTISIDANAVDDRGVMRVEYFKNNELMHTVYSHPYTMIWDTKKTPNEHYSIQAKAYDVSGNIGQSNTIEVDVNNITGDDSTSLSLDENTNLSSPVGFLWNKVVDLLGKKR